jgi:hypothetical protein
MHQIVQFTHPGAEHGPDSQAKSHKPWNYGAHRRKFIRATGDYVDAQNRLIQGESLLFWGEWEPPSDVERLAKRPDKFYPRWLHHPYLPAVIPTGAASACSPAGNICDPKCAEAGPQNTDPFVFEGAFKYFVCKQARVNFTKTTGMATLEAGSVILFGSTSGRERKDAFFQLDTVFVIKDWIEYDPSDLKSVRSHPEVSPLYDQLALSKAFPKAVGTSIKLRLYRGATLSDPVNGMYSFSPARVCTAPPVGFQRVKLKATDFKTKLKGSEFLTNNLQSAPKYTKGSADEIKSAWLEIREASRTQGCVEGVRFSFRSEAERGISTPS